MSLDQSRTICDTTIGTSAAANQTGVARKDITRSNMGLAATLAATLSQRSGIKACRTFGDGALSNFQNPKVPPTGGSHLHAHANIVRGQPHNDSAFFSPKLL